MKILANDWQNARQEKNRQKACGKLPFSLVWAIDMIET